MTCERKDTLIDVERTPSVCVHIHLEQVAVHVRVHFVVRRRASRGVCLYVSQ